MTISSNEAFGVIGTGCIMTSNGEFFNLINPVEDDIDIHVIAHGLAKKDRASGMYNVRFSVAEHSIMVAYLAKYYAEKAGCNARTCNDIFLKGLLHDAAEAYLVDLPRPVKYLPGFATYRDMEKNLQDMIYRKYDLDYLNDDIVKKADNAVLIWEFYEFMSGSAKMPWVLAGIAEAEADIGAALAGIDFVDGDLEWEEVVTGFIDEYNIAMNARTMV